MSDDEAIRFLKTVQPLPDDSELSEELIGRFDEVREHFVSFPNELAVPLLLNSFGNGSGFGVYQLVKDAITGVPSEKVIMHLINALGSPHSSVRYWATEIAANYDDLRLIAPLTRLLQDPSADTRIAALVAIEGYLNKTLIDRLRQLRTDETDTDVQEFYDEILSSAASDS